MTVLLTTPEPNKSPETLQQNHIASVKLMSRRLAVA